MAEYRLNISGAEVETRLNRVPQIDSDISAIDERVTILEAGGGGGGTGSVVVVNPILTSGTKIAEITVNGNKKNLYAPNGGGESYDDTEIRQMIAEKYTKPSTGIPASDIADGVIPSPVTDDHINSLIDAKLTPLEELADTLNTQALAILGGL